MIFEGQSIIDMLFELLQQLLIPNWSDLIALLPWVLIVLWSPSALVFTALQWRRAGARNRSRVPRRVRRRAAAGRTHARAVALAVRRADRRRAAARSRSPCRREGQCRNAEPPFNLPLFVIGLIVSLVAVGGWLLRGDARVARNRHRPAWPARRWPSADATPVLSATASRALAAARGGALVADHRADGAATAAARRAHARPQPVAVLRADRPGGDALSASSSAASCSSVA